MIASLRQAVDERPYLKHMKYVIAIGLALLVGFGARVIFVLLFLEPEDIFLGSIPGATLAGCLMIGTAFYFLMVL